MLEKAGSAAVLGVAGVPRGLELQGLGLGWWQSTWRR